MVEQDELNLFRNEVKGITAFKQDTFVAPRQKSGQKTLSFKALREKKKKIRAFIFPMNISRC